MKLNDVGFPFVNRFIVVAERESAHHHFVLPAPTHSYCSSMRSIHLTRIQSVQSATLILCLYLDRDNRLVAAAAAHDDDDCHEHHVHVGLAYGVGGVGDEVVPDVREAAKILASVQEHYHGHLSEPSRFLRNWNVMAFLPLSDFVEGRLYLSTVRLQHK